MTLEQLFVDELDSSKGDRKETGIHFILHGFIDATCEIDLFPFLRVTQYRILECDYRKSGERLLSISSKFERNGIKSNTECRGGCGTRMHHTQGCKEARWSCLSAPNSALSDPHERESESNYRGMLLDLGKRDSISP
jgi:hypothetical protein